MVEHKKGAARSLRSEHYDRFADVNSSHENIVLILVAGGSLIAGLGANIQNRKRRTVLCGCTI